MSSANRPPKRGAASPRLQDTIRLSADGLAKVLGDLETRVMKAVWVIDEPAPARAVHDLVSEEHDVAILTVVTVLNKLVEKRLLARHKRDGLLHYSARLTEEELTTQMSRRIVESILSLSPQAVAASLVDVLGEQDREQLEELGRLVRRRLQQDKP